MGRLVGWVLARRPANRKRNEWTVELLGIEPNDRVLEIGFGAGIAIEAASRLATSGCVVGIDHSEQMLRSARKRNAAAIRAGRVVLHCASFAAPPDFSEPFGSQPFGSQPFDKVFTVNALQFGDESEQRVRELSRYLRPGGWLATTFQSRRPGATDAECREIGQQRADLFRRLGFTDVRMEVLPLEPVCAICVLGRTPAAVPTGVTQPD